MKRIVALLLVLSLVLTACAPNISDAVIHSDTEIENDAPSLYQLGENVDADGYLVRGDEDFAAFTIEDSLQDNESQAEAEPVTPPTVSENDALEAMRLPPQIALMGMNDANFLRYIEDSVYESIVRMLDDDAFFVANVEAAFVSNEFLELQAFNSLENIYFGFTLSELNEIFQSSSYVFSVDENTGQTRADRFDAFDDTFERIARNVAIGTGVILVTVTVAVVAPVVNAPAAVTFIFTAAAKGGTVGALTGGTFSGLVSGVVKYVTTGDADQAVRAAMLSASEGYRWGAVTGTVLSGTTSYLALRGATLNGLTMNQAAGIQRQTGWPLDVVRQLHNMDEAAALMQAGLRSVKINGRTVLIHRDINLNQIDPRTNFTNLQLMERGRNPLDVHGNPLEWHHIGQRAEGTLALLTREQHDNPALHGFLHRSEINRANFNRVKRTLNQDVFSYVQAGGTF